MKKLNLSLICLFLTVPCFARIIAVDDDGPADFNNIQAAIDDANDGDTIIVADGIYTGSGNRDIDFGGKAITVKSENGPENCIIDCNGTEDEMHRGFYFHSDEDENSILDGFTITNGVHSTGGGILCTLEASPTIRNNVIKANSVPYDWDGGGGIACRRGASPLIIHNIIQDNHCEPGSGGGGIHCYEAGSPRIINNIVTGNSSSYGGGIEIAIFSDTATIENNIIVGNTASSAAGIACWGTDYEVTIKNNTITGNEASYHVGGIKIENGIVTNCIIWDNRDSDGMHESAQIAGSSLDVNYCCIRGWTGVFGGTGNIGVDPYFVDSSNSDYHLQSAAGRWDPNTESWVTDANTSVAIDAGDPASPVGFEPFPNGGIKNMGAYGGTAEASKSYFGTTPCETIVAGDINGDCKVNFLDFRLMALHWLEDNTP